MTAAQREYRERQVARRNREDLSVLLELRDIEDELGTILKLLDQQDGVIQSMTKYFDDRGDGKSFLDLSQARIEEYRSQISEMKENSHLAQKAVCYISCQDNIYTLTDTRSKPSLISSRNKQMSTKPKWHGGKQKSLKPSPEQ